MLAIETHNLTKVYHNNAGCKNICLSVSEGQVFGLLGPNGAGKSTFVKTLMGLLYPTSGSALLLGKPLGDIEVKRRIGYLPELFRYQEWLTGEGLLEFHARIYKMEGKRCKEQIEKVLNLVGLAGKERYRIKTYSKGMQQRLGLASALLPDPDLIFLDEPTSALDPVGRREVREIISNLKREGKTILLNSHLLSEVEMVCDEVAIIKNGQVVACGNLQELLSSQTEVSIRVADMDISLVESLQQINETVHFDGTRLIAFIEKPEEIPLLVARVVQNGARVYEVIPKQQSLEDLFIRFMGEV